MACNGCKKKDDKNKHSYYGRKNIDGKFVCDFCGIIDGSDKANKICPYYDESLSDEVKNAIYFAEMKKTIKELRLENKKNTLLIANLFGKVLMKYVPKEEQQKVIDDINKTTYRDIKAFLEPDLKENENG